MMTSGWSLSAGFCRMQTKWSDSSVQELKPIEAGWYGGQWKFLYCMRSRPNFARYVHIIKGHDTPESRLT